MLRFQIATVGLALALAACSETPPARPNGLFLSVDDMNDWVGALGYEVAETPHIDRLSERGTLFIDAHAPSPKCNPSRTASLSGLRPSTTGVYANGEWWKPNLPDVVMLPRYFKDNGYYAAGGGKVFHHTPGFNPPDSWDEYVDLITDLKTDGFLVPYRRPDQLTSFDWGPLDKTDMEMRDGATVRWAEEFLSRDHDRPFCLAVGLFQPPQAIPEIELGADPPPQCSAAVKLLRDQNSGHSLQRSLTAEGALNLGLGLHQPLSITVPSPLFSAFFNYMAGLAGRRGPFLYDSGLTWKRTKKCAWKSPAITPSDARLVWYSLCGRSVRVVCIRGVQGSSKGRLEATPILGGSLTRRLAPTHEES